MKRAVHLILGFCIAFGAIAQAQPPIFQGQSIGDNDNDPTHSLRQMLTWRLINTLDMDEEQSEKILPAWNRFNRDRDRLYRQRQQLVNKINTEVELPSVDDDVLREYATQLSDNYKEERDITTAYYEMAQKVLDSRQYAKMIVFEENFKDEVMNQNPFSRRR